MCRLPVTYYFSLFDRAGELALGALFNFLACDLMAKHTLSEDRKFFGQIQAIRDTAGRMQAIISGDNGDIRAKNSTHPSR